MYQNEIVNEVANGNLLNAEIETFAVKNEVILKDGPNGVLNMFEEHSASSGSVSEICGYSEESTSGSVTLLGETPRMYGQGSCTGKAQKRDASYHHECLCSAGKRVRPNDLLAEENAQLRRENDDLKREILTLRQLIECSYVNSKLVTQNLRILKENLKSPCFQQSNHILSQASTSDTSPHGFMSKYSMTEASPLPRSSVRQSLLFNPLLSTTKNPTASLSTLPRLSMSTVPHNTIPHPSLSEASAGSHTTIPRPAMSTVPHTTIPRPSMSTVPHTTIPRPSMSTVPHTNIPRPYQSTASSVPHSRLPCLPESSSFIHSRAPTIPAAPLLSDQSAITDVSEQEYSLSYEGQEHGIKYRTSPCSGWVQLDKEYDVYLPIVALTGLKFTQYSRATTTLLGVAFTKEYLACHSLKGYDMGNRKPALPEDAVEAITAFVSKHYPINKSYIRAKIREKLNNCARKI